MPRIPLFFTLAAALSLAGCDRGEDQARAAPKPLQGVPLNAPVVAPRAVAAKPVAPAEKPSPKSADPAVKDPVAAQRTDAPAPEHPNYQQYVQSLAASQSLPPAAKIDGYAPIAFPVLSDFELDIGSPPPGDHRLKRGAERITKMPPSDKVPAAVKALDGKKVALQGFMIPLDFQDGGTNEFIFVRIVPACYFCQKPRINDWIEVKTVGGKRVPYNGDDPITIAGTLDVGEVYDGAYLLSFYRMSADRVVVSPAK
jgi:hypothetical protein